MLRVGRDGAIVIARYPHGVMDAYFHWIQGAFGLDAGKFTWFLFSVRPLPFFPSFVLSSFTVFALVLFLFLASSVGMIGYGILGTYTYELMNDKLVMTIRRQQ